MLPGSIVYSNIISKNLTVTLFNVAGFAVLKRLYRLPKKEAAPYFTKIGDGLSFFTPGYFVSVLSVSSLLFVFLYLS
jgi:hypothetical protein